MSNCFVGHGSVRIRLNSQIASCIRERRGIASLEYALLGAIVASVLLIGSAGIATGIQGAFGRMLPSESSPSVNVNLRPS
jgi:Flp pilus assembly pilin Flp